MSKTRLLSSLAACWLITVPLAAAPESDSAGVTVELNGAALLHRPPVLYPEDARARGVQGSVVVQVNVDARGNVDDALVLSGPEDLRRAVLESMLEWHFTADAAGSTRQVTVAFQSVPGSSPGAEAAPPDATAGLAPGLRITSINITGLSEEARGDLMSRLPVREGVTPPQETLRELVRTVASFDEHLDVTFSPAGSGLTIYIHPRIRWMPPPPPPAPADTARIRVGGSVQAVKLISKPVPKYPAMAKAAHIQGTVSLETIIGKYGTVQNLTVISGHPLLVPAALEAVRQWVYQPTLLNGNPTEVETEIDVNFSLSQ